MTYHEWIAVDGRRWCLACGSYQVRRDGVWRDALVGPWPGYNRTDLMQHGERPDPIRFPLTPPP
jgi:hypothetical protein